MKLKLFLIVLFIVLFISSIQAADINFGGFSPNLAKVLSVGVLSENIERGQIVKVTESGGVYYVSKFTNPLGDAENFATTVLAFGYLNATGVTGDTRPMTALWYRPAIEAAFD